MHEQPCTCRESRTRFPVSRASPWRIQGSLEHRQTFDRPCFPIEGGCSAKGYDREKAGELTEGWRGVEGRKERAAKEGEKKEQKERRKWRNQRHHPTLDSPGAPLATPFLLPLAHSSSCYSTRPLKALFVPPAIHRPSPFSLPSLRLSFLRPCFSHFVTLYFTPCLDFMRTAKWGYLLRCYSNKCARSGEIIVNLLLKLISLFRAFYKYLENVFQL